MAEIELRAHLARYAIEPEPLGPCWPGPALFRVGDRKERTLRVMLGQARGCPLHSLEQARRWCADSLCCNPSHAYIKPIWSEARLPFL